MKFRFLENEEPKTSSLKPQINSLKNSLNNILNSLKKNFLTKEVAFPVQQLGKELCFAEFKSGIFVFFKENGTDLDSFYLNLTEDGKIFWNIDCPEIVEWAKETRGEKILLLDKNKNIRAFIYNECSNTFLEWQNEKYQLQRNLIEINDNWYEKEKAKLSELPLKYQQEININNLKNLRQAFESKVSVHWYNHAGFVQRKPATNLSFRECEETEMTKKWENIFNLKNGGLPSPNIYLLFLKDAYILNGSIVLDSNLRLVSCTRQLGATLAPYTNFLKYHEKPTSIFDKLLRYKKEGKIKRLTEDKLYFLYGNCHTGFGHHLGQVTPSSFFLNDLCAKFPNERNRLVNLYRGGTSYEPFRNGIYELGLDFSVPWISLTNGAVFVKELIIPSTLENFGNHWFELKSLYKKISIRAAECSPIAKIDCSMFNGIYLARDGFLRNCVNSEAFSKFMRKIGFFYYCPPESLNIYDQIALMSHFDLFFSSYGSGANNIVFGKDNSHLIQPLCGLTDGQSWDYSSAQMMGADYTYAFIKPINPEAPFHEKKFYFNIELFEYAINCAISQK
jgi:hypothetical protein